MEKTQNEQTPQETKPVEKEAASNQTANKSSGMSKGCLVAIIVVVVLLVLLGIGGFIVGKFVMGKAKNSLESAVSAGTGGKLNLDTDKGSIKVSENGQTLEVGTKNSWPADMPSDVPKYSGGEIQSASRLDNATTQAWTVIIAKTKEADFTAYGNTLAGSGWSKEDTNGVIVNLSQFKKNDLTMTLAFDPSSNGVNLTVVKDLK